MTPEPADQPPRTLHQAIACWLLLCAACCAPAAELRVAVASNFLPTLQKLQLRWEARSGDRLLLSAASTGQLYAQIQAGAPFDIFLAADQERPQLLEAAGKSIGGSRFTYAVGALVLWSRADPDVRTGERWLRARRYAHLAVADAGTAPYGLAARQLLQALGLWDALTNERKIVTGTSIAQAMQFADSGNAEAAFIALSQLRELKGSAPGFTWLPPPRLYAPIQQDAVVITGSSVATQAQRFLDWLRSDREAAAIMRAAGYSRPAS